MEGFLAIIDLNSSRLTDTEKWLRYALNNGADNECSVNYIVGSGFGLAIVARRNNSDVSYLDNIDRVVYVQGWISPVDAYQPEDLILLADDKIWSSRLSDNQKDIKNFSGGYQAFSFSKNSRTITCFSDRTASRPMYYSVIDEILIISSDIRWIYSVPIAESELDLVAISQFVRIQTIIENRTLYRNIKRIPQGAYLTVENKTGNFQPVIHTYWSMLPLVTYDSDEEAIRQTAIEFIRAGERITKGGLNEKAGILLSGGMDSRTILAVVKPHVDDLSAFTFGMDLNQEVSVAATIARTMKIPWNFIHQSAEDYIYQRDEITPVLQGRYSLAHTNTFKASRYMSLHNIQSIYHGGLMDPFFAGSYLPKELIRILGRKFYTYRLAQLEVNKEAVAKKLLISRDVQNGEFRASYLDDKYRELWETSSIDAYKSAVDKVAEDWLSPYDWFEKALVNSGFSNFYTYPVTASIRLHARERSVLYESNILDLYLRLSIRQRFLGYVYRRALLAINNEIAKIVYPNIGVSPLAPPLIQALCLQGNAFIRASKDRFRQLVSKIRNTSCLVISPGCYPDMKDVVGEFANNSTSRITSFRKQFYSGYLVQTGIVSMTRIRDVLENVSSVSESDALTILALISLSNWLDKYPAKV